MKNYALIPAGFTLAALSFAPTLAADEAGDFDFYVLSLSWNAAFCHAEGTDKGYDQCDGENDPSGLVLHGLWPQYDNGSWPEYCTTSKRNPSRAETRDRADLFGASGSAWHQWNKHGRCSGLSAADYYDLSDTAFRAITTPPVLLDVDQALTTNEDVIEDAFIEVNPDYRDAGMLVTGQSGIWRELRLCLDTTLVPIDCPRAMGEDARGTLDILPDSAR